jgi:hypothetical protein
MLDSDIVPLFGDKFAQVRLGRITLRSFCQTINVKLSGPSIQLAEPTNIGWHNDDRGRWDGDPPPKLTPLPQLRFELERTGNVIVDGLIDDFYGFLAKLQNSSIEGKAVTVMFRGLLISKFHTKESQSSDAFPRFYGLLLNKEHENEDVYKRANLFFIDPPSCKRFIGTEEDDYEDAQTMCVSNFRSCFND